MQIIEEKYKNVIWSVHFVAPRWWTDIQKAVHNQWAILKLELTEARYCLELKWLVSSGEYERLQAVITSAVY